jgi:ribA/ribD-fused uncharacterized protein
LIADTLVIDGTRYTVDTLNQLPKELSLKSMAENRTTSTLRFYGGGSPFSNFYKVKMDIAGKTFNSSEQYYQYQKCTACGENELAGEILKESEPINIYRLAKKVKNTDHTWNDKMAKEHMEIALMAKFSQNEELKQELLDTGDKKFIECNSHDLFWSCGLKIMNNAADEPRNWTGQNNLGVLLCKIRDVLSK